MSGRFPHTFVLLFLLIAGAAAATHFIPAGAYDRVLRDDREVVDPGSYHPLPPRPAGPAEVLLAYPRGLIATAPIVVYIFLIGGAFGVLQATGAIEAALAALVRASGGRGPLALGILLFVFALGGGTIGLAEETLPFIPPLVLLARRLGYDETTGAAIALVGAGAGFSGAFINPFTVGVGQAIAGLPLFSGMGYRLIVWTVLTALAILYVELYARRIRGPAAAAPGDDATAAPTRATFRQRLVLALLGAALAILVVGAMRWSWGLLELSGLFVALAIAAGLGGGLGANGTAERFLEGAAAIVPGALVVGLARGVLVIFDGAQVTDTILHALVETVRALPSEATLAGMYGVQVVLSYVMPSGSGQAALSLPILVPLGDLVGVTRQTSVLAYQLGDGFSNILTPTQGYFMAALALAGVPWTRWARFIWPLQLAWLVAGLALLLLAHAIGWS